MMRSSKTYLYCVMFILCLSGCTHSLIGKNSAEISKQSCLFLRGKCEVVTEEFIAKYQVTNPIGDSEYLIKGTLEFRNPEPKGTVTQILQLKVAFFFLQEHRVLKRVYVVVKGDLNKPLEFDKGFVFKTSINKSHIKDYSVVYK